MNPLRRAKAMLDNSSAEWALIERESGDPAYLLSRYVAALALVPAIAGLVAASIIGAVVPGAGLVRANLFDGLFGAIFIYVESFAVVVVLAFVIDLSAPLFGGQKDFDNALKLAVYSFTPVWLAGIFLVLPGLRFLTLTSFYGAYVLATGLPRLMKTRSSPIYVLAVVVCTVVLIAIAIAVQRTVFGTKGI
jgi:Yip1-like protein